MNKKQLLIDSISILEKTAADTEIKKDLSETATILLMRVAFKDEIKYSGTYKLFNNDHNVSANNHVKVMAFLNTLLKYL